MVLSEGVSHCQFLFRLVEPVFLVSLFRWTVLNKSNGLQSLISQLQLIPDIRATHEDHDQSLALQVQYMC